MKLTNLIYYFWAGSGVAPLPVVVSEDSRTWPLLRRYALVLAERQEVYPEIGSLVVSAAARAFGETLVVSIELLEPLIGAVATVEISTIEASLQLGSLRAIGAASSVVAPLVFTPDFVGAFGIGAATVRLINFSINSEMRTGVVRIGPDMVVMEDEEFLELLVLLEVA